MLVRKIKHPYRDKNTSTNKEPENTSKCGKKLCILSYPPKSGLHESEEDWAKRFLEKIASDLE
jgi:hypothetical protein